MEALPSSREQETAAASRILDADIAQETANVVKARVHQQVASAVLAQAKQQPLLVLQLLRDG